MRKILSEQSNLVAVETYGFKIDFDSFKVIDFSSISKSDMFYKGKGRIRMTGEEYLIEALKKGCGIFLDDKVYYSSKLSPELRKKSRQKLEGYLNNLVNHYKKDVYGIQKYLICPEYEILVRNAIRFYDMNYDINFVRRILEGKVKDVEVFIEYLENRGANVAY